MEIGFRAWLFRRDPDLLAVRRAGRVTVVACLGFYVCYYLVHDPVMATYSLFAAIAMGFLSQIPGPGARLALTLLGAMPVALLLVAAGTMLAGTLWAATAGMLAFGFLIAYLSVGGPRLVGLSAGLQLFFILACFPPYAPDTLTSRLVGVCVGLGLLALAERTLWPDRDPVSYQALLANACEGLADHLATRATGGPDASVAMFAAVQWPAEATWPSVLPSAARPASPGRRDQALTDAGSALSFVLARLREMPSGPAANVDVRELLDTSARTAQATAQALRGGPPPNTDELAGAFRAVQTNRRENPMARGSRPHTDDHIVGSDGRRGSDLGNGGAGRPRRSDRVRSRGSTRTPGPVSLRVRQHDSPVVAALHGASHATFGLLPRGRAGCGGARGGEACRRDPRPGTWLLGTPGYPDPAAQPGDRHPDRAPPGRQWARWLARLRSAYCWSWSGPVPTSTPRSHRRSWSSPSRLARSSAPPGDRLYSRC